MTLSTSRLPRLLTVAETAVYLRLCTKTVRRKIAQGELAAHRDGRVVRIAEPDLLAYTARCKMQSIKVQ
jgi:excisionase family DNA binding protein